MSVGKLARGTTYFIPAAEEPPSPVAKNAVLPKPGHTAATIEGSIGPVCPLWPPVTVHHRP